MKFQTKFVSRTLTSMMTSSCGLEYKVHLHRIHILTCEGECKITCMRSDWENFFLHYRVTIQMLKSIALVISWQPAKISLEAHQRNTSRSHHTLRAATQVISRWFAICAGFFWLRMLGSLCACCRLSWCGPNQRREYEIGWAIEGHHVLAHRALLCEKSPIQV